MKKEIKNDIIKLKVHGFNDSEIAKLLGLYYRQVTYCLGKYGFDANYNREMKADLKSIEPDIKSMNEGVFRFLE